MDIEERLDNLMTLFNDVFRKTNDIHKALFTTPSKTSCREKEKAELKAKLLFKSIKASKRR